MPMNMNMMQFELTVILLSLIMSIGLWPVFVKAGEPAWKALVPVYNYAVVLRLVGLGPWWAILFLIPTVRTGASIITYWRLARAFGCSTGMTILTALIPVIFVPVIGYGAAQYTRPEA